MDASWEAERGRSGETARRAEPGEDRKEAGKQGSREQTGGPFCRSSNSDGAGKTWHSYTKNYTAS
eukprot:5989773-Pyramimonas_sp.AAC.1